MELGGPWHIPVTGGEGDDLGVLGLIFGPWLVARWSRLQRVEKSQLRQRKTIEALPKSPWPPSLVRRPSSPESPLDLDGWQRPAKVARWCSPPKAPPPTVGGESGSGVLGPTDPTSGVIRFSSQQAQNWPAGCSEEGVPHTPFGYGVGLPGPGPVKGPEVGESASVDLVCSGPSCSRQACGGRPE